MPIFRFKFRTLSVATFILAGIMPVSAQYETRMSATGSEAAYARTEVKKNQIRGYNVKLGQVEFKFSGGLQQEYNDNVGLSQKLRKDDWITTPHVNLGAYWPISELNSLDIKLGLAYAKYWNNSNLDSSNILIQPDSLLDFNVYVGDVRFILRDTILIQQDPSAQPQLSNLATFRRLNNTVGLGMEWDLNAIFLKGGYDYEIFKSLENRFTSLDSATRLFRGSVGMRVSPTINAGIQSSYSMTNYEQRFQNNVRTYSVGPFADVIISEFLRGSVAVGFQGSSFDRGGSIGDNTDFQSFTYLTSLQHQLNRWLNYSAGLSRFTTPGIGANFTDIYQFSYQVGVDVIKNVTTSLSFNYQLYHDSKSIFAENGSRYTISPKAGYQLFEKASLNLGYQYLLKESNILGNGYDQNRFFVDLTYQF